MAPRVLYSVIHGTATPLPYLTSRTTISSAILHGYCRRRVHGADFPAIIPASGFSVRGTYVRGLSEIDFARLDAFEGCMYTLETVDVRILDDASSTTDSEAGEGGDEANVLKPIDDDTVSKLEGPVKRTRTYVWCLNHSELEDQDWDFDDFVKTKMRYWT